MRIKTLLEITFVLAFATLALFSCDRDEPYIVSFDANGGTGSMQSQLFDAGVPQALTQNAYTRDGYTFSGWNTMQGGNGTAYSNGQTITVTSDMTLYAQWTSNGTSGDGQLVSGTLNGHEYVDLGLPSGTLWATCNVGANSPEEYGDYFAWGETRPETINIHSDYMYGYGSNITKYNESDGLTILETIDDAATANWGSGWRMPTSEELNELNNNCTVTWTTQNGVIKRLFTGPNGNSIILPFAGCFVDYYVFSAGGSGGYWSSSLCADDCGKAVLLGVGKGDDEYVVCHDYRYYGYSVRPVCNR